MGKRKRDHDPQNHLTNGSGVHVAKKPSSRTKSPPFQQTISKPEAIKGNAHDANKLLSPVVLQVVTGTYDKVLHGFSATISNLHEDKKDSAPVKFADTFMFKAHDSSIRCLAISPPTHHSEKVILASGGSDQVINLYSLSTASFPLSRARSLSKPSLTGNEIRENARNKEVGSLQHHAGAINTLVFPTRSKLLSAADDNTIGVTRTRDWTVLSTIKAPVPKAPGRPSGDTAPNGVGPAGVNGLAIHPSMKLMLSVGKGEKCMRLWNLVTGKKAGVLNFERDLLERIGETKHSSGEGRNVAWNASGDEFAISFERGCIVYGIDSKVKGYIFPSPRTKLHQLAYMSSSSGTEQPRNLLTLSTEDGRILLYSRTPSDDNCDDVSQVPSANRQIEPCAQLGESAAGLPGRIKDFEIVPLPDYNCHCIVTGSSDGAIRFWSVNDSQLDAASSDPSQERADNIIPRGEDTDRALRKVRLGFEKYKVLRASAYKDFDLRLAPDRLAASTNVTAIMATNGDMPSEESEPESPQIDAVEDNDDVVMDEEPLDKPKAVLKKSEPIPEIKRPELPEQPDPKTLDVSKLTPLSPEIIARQATINIGTIGHVAHGKSTVVKAISGVQTVRFKNELERNITIKLGYANAKIYKCDNEACPRPTCYKSYKSEKEVDPPCERPGCGGRYRLVRHVSFVDCPGHDILMSTMLSGAAVMDAALLLIAGNETCPQPQTSEHLAAIEIMKLDHIIILQNKVDLMRSEGAEQHFKSIENFVRGTVADKSPIIPISAQLKYNIDAINERIVNKIPVPIRDFTQAPHMIIIRSFDVNKPGAEIEDLKGGVAGGSILTGVLKLDDEIEIRPGLVTKDEQGKIKCRPIFSRVVSLFAEHNDLKFAVPGGLIGVGTRVDPTLCRADRLVGFVLGLKGRLPSIYTELEVSFVLLRRLLGVKTADGKQAKVAKLTKSEVLMVNIGSTATGAKIMGVKADAAKIQLTSPACTEIGEKIALSRRIEKHWRLIGWANIRAGTTLEPTVE